jgi:signal transduction histidine kinase
MEKYSNSLQNEDKIYEDQDESVRFTLLGKFASILFHEIGSSLCKMKMNLDVYKDSFSNNDELVKVYNTFQTEITHLNKLSNEIKQYSRKAVIIPANINIFLFFESIKDQVSRKLIEKRITLFNYTIDNSIINDYSMLQNSFLNLINSLIDSMERDGVLEISSKLLQDSGKISIIIRDNGGSLIDIDPVFNPYDTNQITGSGLSLLIFKQMIKDLGGAINLLSTDNGSTKIEVQLPCELNG